MWLLSHSRFSGTIFFFSLPPFAMAQQKTPPEWRRHKTQNIDMKNCHTDGVVNILAFFNVVASRQISPHFECANVWSFFRKSKLRRIKMDNQGINISDY